MKRIVFVISSLLFFNFSIYANFENVEVLFEKNNARIIWDKIDKKISYQKGTEIFIIEENFEPSAIYGVSPNGKFFLYAKNKNWNVYIYNLEENQKFLLTDFTEKNILLNKTVSIEEIVWSQDSVSLALILGNDRLGNIKVCLYEDFEIVNCISEFKNMSLNDNRFIFLDELETVKIEKNQNITITTKFKNKIIINPDKINPKKSPFSDLEINHPLYKKIIQAVEEGWISGYPDGTIKLKNKVNRAEFAKMLVLAFEGNKSLGSTNTQDLEPGLDFPKLKKISDIEKNAWYRIFLAKAVEKGIMVGYPDLTMKPGKTINGAESLKMVLEAANLSPDSTNTQSLESGLDLQWYLKYATKIKNILGENIPQFVKEENFEYEITRADAISLIVDMENIGK